MHTEITDTKSAHSSPTMPVTALDSTIPSPGDIEKGRSIEDTPDTYLHGLKLVVVFIGLALSVFVIVLDQTILIPAIPVIASDFDAVDRIGWISSSYFLTQCAFILLWGQVLARFSQKTPLMAAIVIFELGSLIAALSRNFVSLIIGRAVAGIGGAAIMVAGMSISAVVIELKRRPIFFGMFGIVFVLGSCLGPIIGGGFTTHATWRWCFFINLPIGAISITAVFFCIPKLPSPKRSSGPASIPLAALRTVFGDRPILAIDGFVSQLCQLDGVGTLIILGGITGFTLALISGGSHGWSDHTVIIGFTCAAVALILLILWEVYYMKEHGMLPLRVVKFRGVWGAAGVAFTRMISSLALMSYLPTFMQATRHQSAIKSAISTLPYACCMAGFGIVGAVVVQKSGRFKWALIAGSAISAVGRGLLYKVKADTAFSQIAGFQVVAALGSGLIMQNAALAAQAQMDSVGLKADIPQATALVSLIQLLGGSLGGSLGGALLTNGLRKYLPSDLPQSTMSSLLQSVDTIWTLPGSTQTAVINGYARALDDVFLIGAAAGFLGVGCALLCRDINIKVKNFKG